MILSDDGLYYFDEIERRWIWTDEHLRLFLEWAEAPIEPVTVHDMAADERGD